MKKRKFSLAYQTIILVVLLSFLPNIIMEAYTNTVTVIAAQNAAIAQIVKTSNIVQQILKQQGNNMLGVTLSDADWTSGMTNIAKKNVPFIKSNILMSVGTGGITFGIVTDLQGKLITQSGDQPQLASEPSFQSLIQSMNGHSSKTGIIQTPKGLAVLTIAGATNNSGNAAPSGYIVFGQTISQQSLNQLKAMTGADFAVGAFQKPFISTTTAITPALFTPFSTALQHGEKVQAQVFTSIKSGTQKLIGNSGNFYVQYAVPMNDLLGKTVGVLYLQQPAIAATNIASEVNFASHVGFYIAIITLVLLLLILIYRIRPIQKVSKILLAVSEGSLSEQVSQSYLKRRDEVGIIATAASQMVTNLRQTVSGMMKEIIGISEQLTTTSHELASTVEQNVNVVGNVSQTANEIADKTKQQAENVQHTAQTLKEMAQAIQQMVTNSDRASQMAGQSSQSAISGLDIIQGIKDKIENIHEDARILSEEIHKLGSRSKEISNFVEVISNISSQTQLLSLNASIEAARAGEHGRGFAVVAQEVQKLADESAKSASRIADLVNTIENEMEKVVLTAARTGTSVNEGLQSVQEAGGAFSSISQSVEEVAGQIMELLAAIEEMSASEDEVNATIQTVSEIANENAEGAKKVSDMTNQQLTTMNKLREATESMEKMANQLKVAIETFKL